MTQMSRDLQALLVDKAMEDEAFKRELLSNPKAAIAQEIGQKWPDGVEIEVLEPTLEKLYLVLPMQVEPSTFSDELSNVSATGNSTLTQEPMDLQAVLIGKAMADEVFKRELLCNPKAVIARESGQEWPDGVEIEVLEPTPEKLYLVLSPQGVCKESLSDELSYEEVEAVAGDIFLPGLPGFSKDRGDNLLNPKVMLGTRNPRKCGDVR